LASVGRHIVDALTVDRGTGRKFGGFHAGTAFAL
jgi:hypothetical protein